jgi:hypothetical protein
MARVWYPATMRIRPLLLVRRHRPIGDTPEADVALSGGRRTFEAAPGMTRLGDLLDQLAPGLVAAGGSVTHWLPDLDGGASGIAAADLGARFDTVVLGSHLVNTPDEALRAALLAAVRRNLAKGGTVIVEHHPFDWLETAAESWSERDGRRLGMVEVWVDPPFVSAVSVYDVAGRTIRQPFTAQVLTPEELDVAIRAAGLAPVRPVSPTWLEASAGPD